MKNNTYKVEIYFENTTKCAFLIDSDNIDALNEHLYNSMKNNFICRLEVNGDTRNIVCIDTNKINYFRILKI